MAKESREIIVSKYDEARESVRAEEGRELTPKEYLDTVAPGKRTTKSARDYIRRLRSGERSGTVLHRRARRDSGKTVRADFIVGEKVDRTSGEIVPDVRSQNLIIPAHQSRLDLYKLNLRKQVDRALRQSYQRRAAQYKKRKAETPALKRLPRTARIVSVNSVRHVRTSGMVAKPMRRRR